MLAVVEHGGAEERLPPPAFLARLLPVLDTFMPLLANYIKNDESEMSCLRALEVSGGETRMGRGGGGVRWEGDQGDSNTEEQESQCMRSITCSLFAVW